MRERAEKLVQELERIGLNRLTAIHVAIWSEIRILDSHTLSSGQRNISYHMINELEGMRPISKQTEMLGPISKEMEGAKS